MAMPTPSAEERAAFLKRFERFGAAPGVETYLALFHPEARLFDDGMDRPLRVPEIPAHIEGVLALVSGFRMRPERWRAREDVVFVEALNAGTIAGTPVSWRAVYRLELDGSLVRSGRRYFDRAPLLAALEPGRDVLFAPLAPAGSTPPALAEAVPAARTAPAALVSELAAAWRGGSPEKIAARFREDATLAVAGVARPLARPELPAHYRRLLTLLGDARLAPRRWAGDDELLFVEWEAPAAGERTRPFALVERFDLADGLVLGARAYFDPQALAR